MKDRGFTYTEVLVALIIVVIGFLLIFNMSFIALSTGSFNKDLMSAKEISSSLLDSLKSLPYTDNLLKDDGDTTDLEDITEPDHIYQLINNDDDHDDVTDEELYNKIDDDNDGKIDEDLKKFSIVINIADNVPLTDTKTISVIVYWKYRGHIRKVMMQGIKRRF